MREIFGDFWEDIDNYHKHIVENFPRNNEDFVIPTEEDMEGMFKLAISMKNKDYVDAEAIIVQHDLPYEVVKYTDIENRHIENAVYYIAWEKFDSGIYKGWGMFAFADEPIHPWVIQVTHPVFDENTHDVAVRIFRYGASSFQMHGSNRYSWESATDQTSGFYSDRITHSDPSGTDFVPILAFQLAEIQYNRVFFQIHGFTKQRTDHTRSAYPGVILSDGTPSSAGGSKVRALSRELLSVGLRPGIYHDGAGYEHSHDAEETSNVFDDEGALMYGDLGAETNNGGNWTNSLNIREGNFLHFEIETIFRLNAPQFTADAIVQAAKKVYPDEDSLLYQARDIETLLYLGRFEDGDPTTLTVYFNNPLKNPGILSDWNSDLTINSLELVNSGYGVKMNVSGAQKSTMHNVEFIGDMTDALGIVVKKNKKVFVNGIGVDNLFATANRPVNRIRKNHPHWPVNCPWSGLMTSGANIIRTRPYNHELQRQENGMVSQLKKRSAQFIACHYKKDFAGQSEVWLKLDAFIPEDWAQISRSVYVARIQESENEADPGIRLNVRKENGIHYWQLRDQRGSGTELNSMTEVKLGEWTSLEFNANIVNPGWFLDENGDENVYEWNDWNGETKLYIDGTLAAEREVSIRSIVDQSLSNIQIGFYYANNPEDESETIFYSNVLVNKERYGVESNYDRIMPPTMRKSFRSMTQSNLFTSVSNPEVIKTIEVNVPLCKTGQSQIKLIAEIFDENGVVKELKETGWLNHGEGDVVIDFDIGLVPGDTVVLYGEDGIISGDKNPYNFEKLDSLADPASIASTFDAPYVVDVLGNVELLSNDDDLVISDELNGEIILEATFYETEKNKHSFLMVENENFIGVGSDLYRIKIVRMTSEGDTPVKHVFAMHTFFDIIDDFQYELIGEGEFLTIDQAAQVALGPTEYTFEIRYPEHDNEEGSDFTIEDYLPLTPVEFENGFGDGNCLELFNELLNVFRAEYELDEQNKKVILAERIGEISDAQIRHNHNLSAFMYENDTTGLSLYSEGYGRRDPDTGEYEEIGFYISPNTDGYRDRRGYVRLRHGSSLRNSTSESYLQFMENLRSNISDIPNYTIEAEVAEVLSANTNITDTPIEDLKKGDEVMIIHDALNVSFAARVVKVKRFPFDKDRPKVVTIGSFPKTLTDMTSSGIVGGNLISGTSGTGSGSHSNDLIDLNFTTIEFNSGMRANNTGIYQDGVSAEQRVRHSATKSEFRQMIDVYDSDGRKWVDNGRFVIEVFNNDEKILMLPEEIPSEKLPNIPAELLPQIPVELIPNIPAILLPQIPVELIPNIPATLLPQIPVEKLPEIPETLITSVNAEALPDVPLSKMPSMYISLEPFNPTMSEVNNVAGFWEINSLSFVMCDAYSLIHVDNKLVILFSLLGEGTIKITEVDYALNELSLSKEIIILNEVFRKEGFVQSFQPYVVPPPANEATLKRVEIILGEPTNRVRYFKIEALSNDLQNQLKLRKIYSRTTK